MLNSNVNYVKYKTDHRNSSFLSSSSSSTLSSSSPSSSSITPASSPTSTPKSTASSQSLYKFDNNNNNNNNNYIYKNYKKTLQTSTSNSTCTKRCLRKKLIKLLFKYLIFVAFILLIIEAIFYLKYLHKPTQQHNQQKSNNQVVTDNQNFQIQINISTKLETTSIKKRDDSTLISTQSNNNQTNNSSFIKLINYKEDLNYTQSLIKFQDSNKNFIDLFNEIKTTNIETYKKQDIIIELCPAIPATLEGRINFTHLFNNTNLADLLTFYENININKTALNQTNNSTNNNNNNIINFDSNSDNLNLLNEGRIYGESVRLGGYWKPTDCLSRSKLAVIIPYRDRFVHLAILLRNLHLILQKQLIEYRIFVTEQYGNKSMPFNKGRIMNAAYLEALKLDPEIKCFVFHDVDLILEDDRNMYTCPPQPRHMSVAIDKFGYHLPYSYLIGGVFLLRTEHFRMMNGYSNSYWGWGGEDDDMYERLASSGLKLTRPLPIFGRYKMVKHTDQKSNPDRFKNLKVANKRFRNDGVNQINYILVNTTLYEGFTHFLFDVGEL